MEVSYHLHNLFSFGVKATFVKLEYFQVFFDGRDCVYFSFCMRGRLFNRGIKPWGVILRFSGAIIQGDFQIEETKTQSGKYMVSSICKRNNTVQQCPNKMKIAQI